MTRLPPLLALFSVLAACAPGSPPPGKTTQHCLFVPEGYGPTGEVPLEVTPVITGLEVPWAITFLPGGDWLVTERPGRVRLVSEGKLLEVPVVTVPISGDEESGLLGIAASPTFEIDRRFYVYATVDGPSGPENRVLRYSLSADHRSAQLDRTIVEGIPAAKYHDGGRIKFGPDGMLYVSTGDARQPELSASRRSPAGKLLRFTPQGEIPGDNPHGPTSPVFVSGIRNCQGFDWITDRFLAVVDHGPSGDLDLQGLDEVNVTVSGLDLGWPDAHGCEVVAGKVPPSLTWAEAVPPAGAAMYRSDRIPEWTGSLLVTTLKSRHLHRVVLHPLNPRNIVRHEVYLAGDPPHGSGRLREITVGPDAHLYVTTSNCDGRGTCPPEKDMVLRITRAEH